ALRPPSFPDLVPPQADPGSPVSLVPRVRPENPRGHPDPDRLLHGSGTPPGCRQESVALPHVLHSVGRLYRLRLAALPEEQARIGWLVDRRTRFFRRPGGRGGLRRLYRPA